MEHKSTVFLVDDELTNLAKGREVLSDKYNVVTMNGGTHFFNTLKKIKPDIVLLDINMPDMNGFEVITRLKKDKQHSNIPVIFLSALSDERIELQGLKLGAVDFILKPFSTPLLLGRIDTHLSLYSFFTNIEKELVKRTKSILNMHNTIISSLAEIVEYRDEVTGHHIKRIKDYLRIIIKTMIEKGLHKDYLNSINMEIALESSQLHDIGKIHIPDYILKKPDKLTPEEFEVIKKHTVDGNKIIRNIKIEDLNTDFLDYAAIFALSHHEKWDGSGYPYGLSGENIPLLGRILAIADVYDALRQKRPYKPSFSHQQAVEIILKDKGHHFDPNLIDLFEKVHPLFSEVIVFRGYT
ncbi:MAG: response regulator [Defluviitaleaceae bacterium]|nr:response regulator [Defluviitaleaceae bacterium]